MITDRGLGALRVAATLTHSLPQLRARLRNGPTALLEIRTPGNPDPSLDPHIRTMEPCAFRCVVGRAHRSRREGRAMAIDGLETTDDPTIDIGMPPGGSARPGGLYRVEGYRDENVWAFATTLDAEIAYETGRDIVHAASDHTGASVIEGVQALGLRRDAATDVTLTFARTLAEPGSAAELALIEILEALLARWATHELLYGETATHHNDRTR